MQARFDEVPAPALGGIGRQLHVMLIRTCAVGAHSKTVLGAAIIIMWIVRLSGRSSHKKEKKDRGS